MLVLHPAKAWAQARCPGFAGSGRGVSSKPFEFPEEPELNAPSDTWDGTRFQTPIDSKRIKVKCGSIQERGTEIVTLEDVVGKDCFVEVRTPDRQVFRRTVSDVQEGLYTCFENHSDTCVFNGGDE